MATNVLDKTGLQTLVTNIKNADATTLQTAKAYTDEKTTGTLKVVDNTNGVMTISYQE